MISFKMEVLLFKHDNAKPHYEYFRTSQLRNQKKKIKFQLTFVSFRLTQPMKIFAPLWKKKNNNKVPETVAQLKAYIT